MTINPLPTTKLVRSRSPIASLWAVLTAVAIFAAPTLAQITTVEPYHVVANTQSALLRSGEMDLAYPVARLELGALLRVDGEIGPWRRVSYPAGVGVIARAADVQVSADGKTATLTKPSSLRAHNVNDGVPGSWKPVLATALPVGTPLKVIRAVDHAEARHRAYLVEPPAAARAFVHESQVRRATDEEVSAQPRPTGSPEQPAEQPRATTPTPVDLTQPQQPTTQPAQPTNPQPTTTQPTPTQPTPTQPTPTQPAATEPTTTTDRPLTPTVTESPAHPEKPQLGSWDALEQAFQAVRGQNELEAEIDELINAYELALSKLGQTEEDNRVRRAMNQRVELLKIRRELQQERRRLAAVKEEAQKEAQRLAAQYANVQATRRYAIVGRLTTSIVYDGQRLPRLLRIQSVGEPLARTLAYIKPEPELELDSKVGEVVGVIGEVALDQTVNLTVVNPTRVDVLRPDQTP